MSALSAFQHPSTPHNVLSRGKHRDQFIRRAEFAWLDAEQRQRVEHLEFFGRISAQVDLRALESGVTEPQRYLPNVARRLKHVHGAAMAQHMGRYRLRRQRGRHADGGGDVLFEDVFEAGARRHTASGVQEERRVSILGSNRDPGADRGSGLLPEWEHALPSSFADDMDAGG